MPTVHREVELTYAADDAFELPPLTELVSGPGAPSTSDVVALSDGVSAVHRLEAVHYGTADPRLAAAGLTLRRRTGGDELLHDARKAATRARYAGEAVAVAFGDSVKAFAAALEEVQEALGERQDSLLTRARLPQLALQAASPEVAFLHGRLHARAARRKAVHRWLP